MTPANSYLRGPVTPGQQRITVRLVTTVMVTVIALSFLFGFGNVWSFALRLGVTAWVAPLVAPAVDLSVLGLLVGVRCLALHGAGRRQLRSARVLLCAAGMMTLALNVADPLLAGHPGKAAFDAVGPLLLIGWCETGPGLLQALHGLSPEPDPDPAVRAQPAAPPHAPAQHPRAMSSSRPPIPGQPPTVAPLLDETLVRKARAADAQHWAEHHRPISAETLRKHLGVGAARARRLVAQIRSAPQTAPALEPPRSPALRAPAQPLPGSTPASRARPAPYSGAHSAK
ncbi:SpdA protein [Streptomyces sp. ODS28]|uniref:SpdA protein n=1 Tax=Streptomyces sp. ODS28 TaxID=3136688 RepID=UPI0031E93669